MLCFTDKINANIVKTWALLVKNGADISFGYLTLCLQGHPLSKQNKFFVNFPHQSKLVL